MSRWFILPGRHQPPHRDHFALIRAALERVPGELQLGLIVPTVSRAVSIGALEAEAREQNRAERCPFGFEARRALIEAGLTELCRADAARVQVSALPRPEAAWREVVAKFPGARTWIVPDVGEAFDALKAADFRARGDAVIRIELTPTTDGRQVRDALSGMRLLPQQPRRGPLDAGERRALAAMLPERVIDALERMQLDLQPPHPIRDGLPRSEDNQARTRTQRIGDVGRRGIALQSDDEEAPARTPKVRAHGTRDARTRRSGARNHERRET